MIFLNTAIICVIYLCLFTPEIVTTLLVNPIDCHFSLKNGEFRCKSDLSIVVCDADLHDRALNADFMSVGFFQTANRLVFDNRTRFPLYAKNESDFDYKNYSLDGHEYTLHHLYDMNDKGIRVFDHSCFKSLWTMFKKFGKRTIISLETSVKNYLPTASIFGHVKFED